VEIKLAKRLTWLGHDSFRLDGPKYIYFDPWKLAQGLPQADIVFVSHEHGDHCSPADVKKISGPDTVVVASRTAAPSLAGDVRVMVPGDTLTIGEIEIEAVPAYNVNKFRAPGMPFHPQSALHNGYVVMVNGERIYFAGDTDHIPEMADIRCDVALLPVSGTYVMTAEEAAEAARTIRPKVAVPMHYGAGVAGSVSDAERFKELYGGEVIILTKQ
jgi:L-ascorbate metabolism protein UlaG (beta-lactamase superfamily)